MARFADMGRSTAGIDQRTFWAHAAGTQGQDERAGKQDMSLAFEWDADKAGTNLSKHGVSFDEAATAFGDPLSITIPDPVHSHDEDRYILMGSTYQERLLVVVHTERDDRIRIISARQATGLERRTYEG